MTNIDQRFPSFKGNETQEQKTRMILDYLYMLREYLQYVLNNLSPDNFNQTALDGLVDEIRAGVVVANTMISNTVITNNLYAEYGDISELTVDRLLTLNKVEKYWASDTSEANYIKMQDQTYKAITGTTDGSTTQLTDRYGALMYWKGAVTASTYKTVGMSTTPTAYPVTVYDYTELVKMTIGHVYDSVSGYWLPQIILGAGDGATALSGKTVITKITDGIEFNYYARTTGDLRQIKLGDDGITMTPSADGDPVDVLTTALTGLSTATNEAIDSADTVLGAFGKLQAQASAISPNIIVVRVVNENAVTVLNTETEIESLLIHLQSQYNVPVYVSLSATAADATHGTLNIYLDSVLKYAHEFLALTTDEQNYCFTGLFNDVAAGDRAIEFKAVAADANLSIAASGFLGYAIGPLAIYTYLLTAAATAILAKGFAATLGIAAGLEYASASVASSVGTAMYSALSTDLEALVTSADFVYTADGYKVVGSVSADLWAKVKGYVDANYDDGVNYVGGDEVGLQTGVQYSMSGYKLWRSTESTFRYYTGTLFYEYNGTLRRTDWSEGSVWRDIEVKSDALFGINAQFYKNSGSNTIIKHYINGVETDYNIDSLNYYLWAVGIPVASDVTGTTGIVDNPSHDITNTGTGGRDVGIDVNLVDLTGNVYGFDLPTDFYTNLVGLDYTDIEAQNLQGVTIGNMADYVEVV